MSRLFIGLALVLACVVVVQAWGAHTTDKVLLRDVQAVTLKRGAYTAARRVDPIPQLNCVGGRARHLANSLEAVQCRNMGMDDSNNVQWKCEADMESNVRFGKIEVSCEGYNYPDDPFILRGSCGLEYTLEYTSEGEHKRQQPQNQYTQHTTYHHDEHHGGGFRLKTLLMLGVVVFIFYNVYKQCTQMGNSGPNRTYGRGGGPGGYPHNGYGPGGDPYNNYGPGCAPPPTYHPWYQSFYPSWTPGFWSGVATGGFLGRMWNRPHHYGPTYNTASYSGPSYSSFSSGGGGGGGGSTTRTASGFGGTRRR